MAKLGEDVARLALYRKYRPRDFDELYGQDHIAVTLKNSIISGNFSHAYLFSGPRGTGKTSVARILAKAINCEKNIKGNPDNKCNACLSINQEKSLDIIEIDAASHTQVDNIREIIVERAHFAPTSLKYKVYIIDEAHMLSKSSFNALLKTLEEPPAHTVFILATTEANKILPTITSRCQKFDFKRVRTDDIVKRLQYIADEEKIKVEAGVLELIAKNSEGGFRDAISLLDQITSIASEEISKNEVEEVLGISNNIQVEDMAIALAKKNNETAIDLVAKLSEDGVDPKEFIKNLTEYLRKLMVGSLVGLSEVNFSIEGAKTAQEILDYFSTNEIIKTLDIIIQNEKLYKYSSIPWLGLEVAIAKNSIEKINTAHTEKESLSSAEKKEPKPFIEVKNQEKTESKDKKQKNDNKKSEKIAVFDEVKWQELLLEVKNKNNSIHAFLKVCAPEFTDDTLCLVFPYQFHKDRIEESKNRQIVENSVSKVYGQNYKIKCKIKPILEKESLPKAKRDDLLGDALEIFGGEVIE